VCEAGSFCPPGSVTETSCAEGYCCPDTSTQAECPAESSVALIAGVAATSVVIVGVLFMAYASRRTKAKKGALQHDGVTWGDVETATPNSGAEGGTITTSSYTHGSAPVCAIALPAAVQNPIYASASIAIPAPSAPALSGKEAEMTVPRILSARAVKVDVGEGQSISEQLEAVWQLHAAGALTGDEYASAKRGILESNI